MSKITLTILVAEAELETKNPSATLKQKTPSVRFNYNTPTIIINPLR